MSMYRIIMKQLDAAVRECELNLPHLSTLTDSTTQKISLKKWVAKETDAEVDFIPLVFGIQLKFFKEYKSKA